MDGQMDRWGMDGQENGCRDGQTDGQNIPFILQDIAPLGLVPCSQSKKPKKDWQGKVTTDHILSLDDWLIFVTDRRTAYRDTRTHIKTH